ncbi:hypothetical protein PXW85_27060, partial [Klebsiella pneumoniae]|nr:hypothetical protein [Klebsiella pneumoniae]
SSIIIAMIMTSTGLPEMGTMLAKSTGSFIATVGLIIMLGAGVPPQGTTAVLLASSQVDWFGPFPSSDMFGQMGLAQSTHLK